MREAMRRAMQMYWTFDAARRFALLSDAEVDAVVRGASQPHPAEPVEAQQTDAGEVRIVRLKHDLSVGALLEEQSDSLTFLCVGRKDVRQRALDCALAFSVMEERGTFGGISSATAAAIVRASVRTALRNFGPMSIGTKQRAASVVGEKGRGKSALLLMGDAKRWKTSDARGQFKELLEEAATRPQIIERDGEELVVVSRSLLDRYADPLSGAALVARFRDSGLPRLKVERDAVAPDREILFGRRAVAGSMRGEAG